MITPCAFVLSGIVFFSCVIFKDSILGTTASQVFLQVAVYMGAALVIASRSGKYTFFDSSKEMCFIPLEDSLRTKGKGAVELVGARVGKGSGAFIQQGLLMMFAGSSLIDLAPAFFIIFLVAMACWIFSVFGLSKKFSAAATS
jgi:AAA family ATP:ADP antiporter